MALFEIGDKVHMKPEVVNDLDRENLAWHESIKNKILTIDGIIDDQPAGWIDYYVKESPFCLAEAWLELVEKKESEPNAEV